MATKTLAVPNQAALPSYDTCWSPEIGLASLILGQMEADPENPSHRCVAELLRNAIKRRRFRSEDAALLRNSAIEIASTIGRTQGARPEASGKQPEAAPAAETNKPGDSTKAGDPNKPGDSNKPDETPKQAEGPARFDAPKWFPSLMRLIRLLETHAPNVRKAIALENYLAKARADFDLFAAEWTQVKRNRAFFFHDSPTDMPAELRKHISDAENFAGKLMADLQSCDCARKISDCLRDLRTALRECERCHCVLLCELKDQIYIDACIAGAQARLIDSAYYTRLAERLSHEITAEPGGVQPDIEALQAAVNRLIAESQECEKAECAKVQPLLQNVQNYAQQLQPGNLETNVSIMMEMIRDAQCTAGEIDTFPVLAALIQLECRSRRPVPPPAEKLEDALVTILKLVLGDKFTSPTEEQKKAVAVIAHALQGTLTAPAAEQQAGYDLTYSPKVATVQGQDLTTGEKFQRTVVGGRVVIPYPAGRQVRFTAYDSLGNEVDRATLISTL